MIDSRRIKPVRANNRTSEKRAQPAVRSVNGNLVIEIDGKQHKAVVLDIDTSFQEYSKLDLSSASLVNFRLGNLCWLPETEVDLEDLLPLENLIKALGSDTHVMLTVPVDAPVWWLAAHPGELCGYAAKGSSPRTASWASHLWRKSAGDALERLIRYLLSVDTHHIIFAIQIEAGECGAFIYPQPELLPDAGPCMRAALVKFALEKYRRNGGLLRKAWFDTRIEFKDIVCPGDYERGKSDIGVLRNPHRSRRLLDFYECLAIEQNHAALAFCSVVKSASNGHLLAGLASAPLSVKYALPECGHTFPDELLSADSVDFFVENQNLDNCGVFRPYRGSARLNGKLVLARSRKYGQIGHSACRSIGVMVPAPATEFEASMLSKLVNGFDKPAPKTKKHAPKIGLILDPAASNYLCERDEYAPIGKLVLEQIDLFLRSGIEFSIFSYSDLFQREFPDLKVALMPNCFYLSDAERRRLDARVKRSDTTAVWFWAPGVISEERINAEEGTLCSGQKLRVELTPLSLKTRIAVPNDELTRGRHAGSFFGETAPVTPACTIPDKQAIRLGANSDNKTTYAVRRYDTWTSVVFGTLPVPVDLLQNVFRSAGCHIYCDRLAVGATVSCDARFLAISTEHGATFSISLPGVFDVVNVSSNEPVGKTISEFTVVLANQDSALFALKAHTHP